jgi:hypothetical protein
LSLSDEFVEAMLRKARHCTEPHSERWSDKCPAPASGRCKNTLVTTSTAVPRQGSVPSVLGIALRQASSMLAGFPLVIMQSRSVRPRGSPWRLHEPLSCLKVVRMA